MRTAPDSSRYLPQEPPSGAASLSLASARAVTAVELRNAGSLRRDAAIGVLPRGPAISAIRDCLRHARYTRNVAALLLAGTLLAACATPQTAPVLPVDDTANIGIAAPKTVREATDRAINRVKPEPRPAVR